MVAAHPNVYTRVHARTALPHDDRARQDQFSVEALHTQSLGLGIAPILGATATLLVCHSALLPILNLLRSCPPRGFRVPCAGCLTHGLGRWLRSLSRAVSVARCYRGFLHGCLGGCQRRYSLGNRPGLRQDGFFAFLRRRSPPWPACRLLFDFRSLTSPAQDLPDSHSRVFLAVSLSAPVAGLILVLEDEYFCVSALFNNFGDNPRAFHKRCP